MISKLLQEDLWKYTCLFNITDLMYFLNGCIYLSDRIVSETHVSATWYNSWQQIQWLAICFTKRTLNALRCTCWQQDKPIESLSSCLTFQQRSVSETWTGSWGPSWFPCLCRWPQLEKQEKAKSVLRTQFSYEHLSTASLMLWQCESRCYITELFLSYRTLRHNGSAVTKLNIFRACPALRILTCIMWHSSPSLTLSLALSLSSN